MSQNLFLAAAGLVFLLAWFGGACLFGARLSLERAFVLALVPSAGVLVLGGLLSVQDFVGFGVLGTIFTVCFAAAKDSAQDIGYLGRHGAVKSGLVTLGIGLVISLCLLAGAYSVFYFLGVWGNKAAEKFGAPEWLVLTFRIPEWIAAALASPFRFLLPSSQI